jgi:hypothetical protein
MPLSAALVGLLNLPQFMLKPRHQIFGDLYPASFIEDLGLGLNDPLLGSLALPTNVIYLLLQGATIDRLTVQSGLKCLSLAFQFCGLCLGICELLTQGVI